VKKAELTLSSGPVRVGIRYSNGACHLHGEHTIIGDLGAPTPLLGATAGAIGRHYVDDISVHRSFKRVSEYPAA
jgi:hypothetical protein